MRRPYDGVMGVTTTREHPESLAAVLDERLMRGLMLAPAGANVVWQLARRSVGRGVAESRVTSGSLTRHPLKRTRTTLAYIWVALYGTEDERLEMRRHVDAQHRHVRSRPGDDVAYDAVDPDAQLWVAACMYVGCVQGYETLYGRPDEDVALELLHRCGRFATTLQVPAHRWPSDLAAFARYWTAARDEVCFDEVTEAYLRDFVELRFVPRVLRAVVVPLHRLLVGGFLDADLRSTLGLDWDARRARRFARVVRALAVLNRLAPRPVAALPWTWVAFDTRRRLARRRNVV